MRHSKDSAYLIAKGYIKIVKDTLGMDDDIVDKEEFGKLKDRKSEDKKPLRDSIRKVEAIKPEEKKIKSAADSSKGL